MAKSAFTAQQKYELIIAFQNRTTTIENFCLHHHIDITAIKQWRYLYETFGITGLEAANGCKRYPKELKEAAIHDYLSGKYSLIQVARKYGISSDSVLVRWLKLYNGHREIKGTKAGIGRSMTKGKTTTFEERIEIVMYCIKNNKNYHATAQHFGVSYQQVYQWVKKFEENGQEALQDKRGRRKPVAELTAEEKLQRDMKRLEIENERLRAENAFLKKLEELERRRS